MPLRKSREEEHEHDVASRSIVESIQRDLDARTDEVNRRRRITEWVRNLVFILVLFLVWVASFSGRAELVKSQRAGCFRGIQDRLANAAAWDEASKARRSSGDIDVALKYARISQGFITRAGVPLGATDAEIEATCFERYPDPGPFAVR